MPITVPHPSFDFPALVRDRVQEEEKLAALDAYDSFDSHSPLSLPPQTPPPSSPTPENLSLADVPNLPPLEPASSTKLHAKRQSKRNRHLKRQRAKDDRYAYDYEVPPPLRFKHTHATDPIAMEFDTDSAPHASTAYVGLREESWKREHTLDELLSPEYSFRHCPWIGQYIHHRSLRSINSFPPSTPTPIIDREGRIIAALAGQPDDPKWNEVHEEAIQSLESLRKQCKFSEDQRKHRRGKFGALSIGISYGGGQTHPQNLHHNKSNTAVLMALLNTLAFVHLAAFASSAFATWAPNLFHYYATHLCDLLVHDATLVLNWASSIFASATFNFGPRTLCFRHTDSANLPFGWCTITALGRYNFRRGGHLVLWDLKLVVDFPPGSTILIPSAILRHSNTAIGKRE
ncbi:uncharacterized protein EV420DRAFT_1485394 [Desarmillaria tabescens]|uniref:Uncharacterized protein n=1 Tax=Armillaria tabescens TaxID=1929756 RepID=A0AA39JI92_ARMTA|nr:uncharacterized protein EV420DRAFT_1485394 [Desarmillaria tabescens]KAK0442271.1 hypothetical protein EV420DRAFT_1485394 [Desarmillaria tabescens]